MLPVVLDNMGTLVNLIQAFAAIKIAQVVAGFAGGLGNLSRLTVGNMRVQVALNRAVAAYSPAAAAALRSTTLLGAGLRGLRAVTATLLVTFRAAFASIGGIIGIAAAALSFFAFEAMASVDDTMSGLNETMRESERLIGDVGKAYSDAAGNSKQFRDSLSDIDTLSKGVSLSKLRRELGTLRSGAEKKFGVNEKSIGLGAEFAKLGPSPAAARNLDAYIARFNAGLISAEDLKEGFQRLDDEVEGFADIEGLDDFLTFVDKVGEAETQIAKLEAELAVIDGTATDAQRALLGMGEALDEEAAKAKAAKAQTSAFEAALRELGENIPSVNDKLEEFDAIRDIEADFQAAMEAADAFTDAAKRAAAIGSAVDLRNRAYDSLYAGQVAKFDGTDGAEVAAEVIRSFEGFRATPYNDPRTDAQGNQVGANIYRAGYGSDTITLSDGTIKKVTEGMRVSVGDSNRDLLRRITTEFMPTARNAAGAERFDSFTAQQQAALTSIAYNYGEIPDRIVAAVRTGTNEEIASAIKSLGGDNGGVNKTRRRKEAALFTSTAGAENVIAEQAKAEEKRVKDAEKLAEDQKKFTDGLREQTEKTAFLNSLEGQRLIDAEVAKAIRKPRWTRRPWASS